MTDSETCRRQVEALVRAGVSHYAAGRLKEALSCWEEALALDPDDREALDYSLYVERHMAELDGAPLVTSSGVSLGDWEHTGARFGEDSYELMRVDLGVPEQTLSGAMSAVEVEDGWSLDGEDTKADAKVPLADGPFLDLGEELEEPALDLGFSEPEPEPEPDSVPTVSARLPEDFSVPLSGDTHSPDLTPQIDTGDVRLGGQVDEDKPKASELGLTLELEPSGAFDDLDLSDMALGNDGRQDTIAEESPPGAGALDSSALSGFAGADSRSTVMGVGNVFVPARKISLAELADNILEEAPTKTNIRPPLREDEEPEEATLHFARPMPQSEDEEVEPATRQLSSPLSQDMFADLELGAGRDNNDGSAPTTELNRELAAAAAAPEILTLERLSHELLVELDAVIPPVPSTDETVRNRVRWLIERASRDQAGGRHAHAVVAADLAMSEAPVFAVAQKLIHEKEAELAQVFADFLGNCDRIPRLKLGIAQLTQQGLDSRTAFLISRVDGMLSYSDIIDVSGMPEIEVSRHLCRLVLIGIIGVD